MPETRERNTVNTYNKSAILKELREAETAVMDAIVDYKTQVAIWRQEAPKRFAEFAANWDPDNGFYRGNLDGFSPPTLSKACQDYRVQQLNKTIVRIDAMAADSNGNIKLYRQDPLFDYLGYASCL